MSRVRKPSEVEPAGRRRPIVAEPEALPHPNQRHDLRVVCAIPPGVSLLIWLDTKTYAAFREAAYERRILVERFIEMYVAECAV
jgi:hypothetical protein